MSRLARLSGVLLVGTLLLSTPSLWAQEGEESTTEREAKEAEDRARMEAERLRQELRELELEHERRAQELRRETEEMRRELELEMRRTRERLAASAREAEESREVLRRREEELRQVERQNRIAMRDAERARAAEERVRALALRESRPLIAMLSDRPRFGITVRDAVGEYEGRGAEVESVRTEGPAAEAGMQVGDVIVEIDGRALETASRESDDAASLWRVDDDGPSRVLVEEIRELAVDEPVSVVVVRDGERRELNVVPRALSAPSWPSPPLPSPAPEAPLLGSLSRVVPAPTAPRPDAVPLPDPPVLHFFGRGLWHDLEAVTVDAKLGEYFGVDRGLLVVTPPSSDLVELQAGDVILAIGAREPTDIRHAMRILSTYEPGERIEVHVMRQRERLELEGRIPERSRGAGLFGAEELPFGPQIEDAKLWPGVRRRL